MKINEVILSVFTGALENIGETKLEEVLDQLYAKDPVQYGAAIQCGHALVTILTPIVEKTGTKIDDAIVAALKNAIETSSAKHMVALIPPPPPPAATVSL